MRGLARICASPRQAQRLLLRGFSITPKGPSQKSSSGARPLTWSQGFGNPVNRKNASFAFFRRKTAAPHAACRRERFPVLRIVNSYLVPRRSPMRLGFARLKGDRIRAASPPLREHHSQG